MSATFELGNFEIDEDSNGDLVIRDSDSTEIFKYRSDTGEWEMLNAPLTINNVDADTADVSTLVDGSGVSHSQELEDTGHGAKHESGGSDELNVTGLSGSLADAQEPTAHATDHESGGPDELDVTGLSGSLADAQEPTTHQATHQQGGADELQVGSLGTASTDTSQFFGPDGSGGIQLKTAGGLSKSAVQEQALAVQFVMGGSI